MEFDNNTIYIIKEPEDKPIKIIFNEYPCPVDSNIRCKYSKFKCEDTELVFSCEKGLRNECQFRLYEEVNDNGKV